MSALQQPVRVFLDTCHLVSIAQMRANQLPEAEAEAPRELFARISRGLVTPVISAEQPYEWGEGRNRDELISVLENSRDAYEVSFNMFVFEVEFLRACLALHEGVPASVPSVVHRVKDNDPVLLWLVRNVPSLREQWSSTCLVPVDDGKGTIRSQLLACSRNDDFAKFNRSAFLQFVSGFRDSADRLAAERKDPESAMRRRLAQLPGLDELLQAVGLDEPAGSAIQRFDIGLCPALSLWEGFWWRYVSNRLSGKKSLVGNDRFDVEYLSAYAYSEFALVEAPMCGHVRSASPEQRRRVFSRAEDLLAALDSHKA